MRNCAGTSSPFRPTAGVAPRPPRGHSCPLAFEKAIAKDPSLIGCFSVAGDSMIFVDKRGQRVVNEKLHYNELAQKFFEWEGANAQFPYLILTSIWDQRAQ